MISERRSRLHYALGILFILGTFWFLLRLNNSTSWILLFSILIITNLERMRTGWIYRHSIHGGNGTRLFRNLGGVWWMFLFAGLVWYFSDKESVDILSITAFSLSLVGAIFSSWYWIRSKRNIIKMWTWFILNTTIICASAYCVLNNYLSLTNMWIFIAQLVFVCFSYWIRKKIV